MDLLHILLWAVVAAIVVFAALAIVVFIVWRRATGEAKDLRRRIGKLPWRAKLRLARILFEDPAVPKWLRLIVPALAIYLAMPLDIIPDFIPVLGQLDDIVVLAAGVMLLLRFVPRDALRAAIERVDGSQPTGGYTRDDA